MTLFLKNVGQTTTHNLRNSDNARNLRCNTQLFQLSSLPSTIDEWNNLPLEIRTSSILAIFKSNLSLPYVNIPKHFCSGSRQTQILHTRLRTSCGSLNAHLFID